MEYVCYSRTFVGGLGDLGELLDYEPEYRSCEAVAVFY
jgi:hypothetical protein